jgi:translation initiation factor IF-3-like protein
MADFLPNGMERGYLLPPGCNDLLDVLKLEGKHDLVPWGIRLPRKNEMITAPQLRVLGVNGENLGVMGRAQALEMARIMKVELVEIAPKANPPVCRLVDYAKLARELSKGSNEPEDICDEFETG